ncbi:MAG TPA: hypothetical protein VGJ84_09305 [Polyangiaceae bacterium]|jgi:hypothetical protein
MASPETSAVILRNLLDAARRDFTIADAAAASGFSLVEAERGLHALVNEYRGHLRVTEEGEMVFRFPHGFTKPWETTGRVMELARAVGRGISGVTRFLVRAWVSIVLVLYAVLFVVILFGVAFAGGGRSGGRGLGRSSQWSFGLFRFLAEALFWTFHPFSPFYAGRTRWSDSVRGRRSRSEPDESVPFYERVDRFFFGPKPDPEDPTSAQRAVVAEIRVGKGRIGLAEVIRVTGLSRSEVDPMMSRLLVDYDGSVAVSEQGGIVYSFPSLRKTASEQKPTRRAPAIWSKRERVPPLTGNPQGSNWLIGGLNAFNLLASAWMIAQGLTIERLHAVLTGLDPYQLPPPGLPIALGVVPLIFSIALFLLPLGRLAFRGRLIRKAQRENGRRAILQAVLENGNNPNGISDAELVGRYRVAAGRAPSSKEMNRYLVSLGADVDLDQAKEGVRYRFRDLELESEAVHAEREAATDEEARLGRVVFSTEE